jgi:hypothetical protein
VKIVSGFWRRIRQFNPRSQVIIRSHVAFTANLHQGLLREASFSARSLLRCHCCDVSRGIAHVLHIIAVRATRFGV